MGEAAYVKFFRDGQSYQLVNGRWFHMCRSNVCEVCQGCTLSMESVLSSYYRNPRMVVFFDGGMNRVNAPAMGVTTKSMSVPKAQKRTSPPRVEKLSKRYYVDMVKTYNVFGADEHVEVQLIKARPGGKGKIIQRFSYSTFLSSKLAYGRANAKMEKLRRQFNAKDW